MTTNSIHPYPSCNNIHRNAIFEKYLFVDDVIFKQSNFNHVYGTIEQN